MTVLTMAGLGLHFILEMAAFTALGVWGVQMHVAGWQKLLWGIGLPLLAALLWGIFRVPNDPGKALVVISGPLRLLLELGVMASAVLALYAAGHPVWAWVFGVAVVVDYLIMIERVGRLLSH